MIYHMITEMQPYYAPLPSAHIDHTNCICISFSSEHSAQQSLEPSET